MLSGKVAKRYALALFDAAKISGQLDIVAVDCNNIIELLDSSKQFMRFFRSPVIKASKKQSVINAVLESRISKLTSDFLKLLVLRNRENVIHEILTEFIRLNDDISGIIKVAVKSAVELSDEQKQNLKKQLDEFSNLNTESVFTFDESLIGGFTVQVKDTVLDASIKRQLELLKNKFRQQSLSI
ncbi:ATP synthase F1 subunit delta [bacterium]|nr:MAG: ATP synthase F1 subunit delta [bacterium]